MTSVEEAIYKQLKITYRNKKLFEQLKIDCLIRLLRSQLNPALYKNTI